MIHSHKGTLAAMAAGAGLGASFEYEGFSRLWAQGIGL